MLKRTLFWLGVGLLGWGVAACQPQTPPALPTQIQLATATFTESAQPTQAEATVVPTRPARPTLPPTFTPKPTETELPTETPTLFPTATMFVPPETSGSSALPPGCETFLITNDSRNIQFTFGTAPTIAWSPAEGAVRYRIILTLPDSGRILKDDIYIAETSYTFALDLFSKDVRIYGWEVYPINDRGDQMCLSQGDIMQIVERR